MAEKRLYVVSDAVNKREHLVMAISGASALKHVVKPKYAVQIASAHDVALIMGSGGEVEHADNDAEMGDNIQHPSPEANKMRVPKG